MECSICTNSYDAVGRRPLVGTCGHTFCSTCIASFRRNRNCFNCRERGAFERQTINFALMELIDPNAVLVVEAAEGEADRVQTLLGMRREVSPSSDGSDSTLPRGSGMEWLYDAEVERDRYLRRREEMVAQDRALSAIREEVSPSSDNSDSSLPPSPQYSPNAASPISSAPSVSSGSAMEWAALYDVVERRRYLRRREEAEAETRAADEAIRRAYREDFETPAGERVFEATSPRYSPPTPQLSRSSRESDVLGESRMSRSPSRESHVSRSSSRASYVSTISSRVSSLASRASSLALLTADSQQSSSISLSSARYGVSSQSTLSETSGSSRSSRFSRSLSSGRFSPRSLSLSSRSTVSLD